MLEINPPILLHTNDDCNFMIATKMEVFSSYGFQQITYFGDVYSYEFGEVGRAYRNGKWVYDGKLSSRIDEG